MALDRHLYHARRLGGFLGRSVLGVVMKVEFSAQITVPDGTPEQDILAWLRFELGATCQLAAGNAMSHTDLECDYVSIDRVMP